jgi:hypothetical protein
MTPSLRWMLPGLLGIIACGGRRGGADRDSVLAVSDAPRPADSLVLTTPAGSQVWFAAARTAQDSSGTRCMERVMEIRSEGRVTPIPLLYTGTPPRLVNDSTIEAAIWRNCRPGNVYRVDLRTGQPVRVK